MKIAVALSGGVDSAVAAALLKEAGHEVVGVHIVCWKERKDDRCSATADADSARRVAGELDIPFYVIDGVEAYRKRVYERMIGEYVAGRTPNPDVWCNEEIKFGFLLDQVLALGFERLATGHYARIVMDQIATNQKPEAISYKLVRPLDLEHDQTYFLYRVEPERLRRVIFPLGEVESKGWVRAKASELGLSVADKDSTAGICLVGNYRMDEFLPARVGVKAGPIVTRSGQVVGEHRGAIAYTTGQRAPAGGSGPWYITRVEPQTNTVVVVQDQNDETFYARECFLQNTIWYYNKPEAISQKLKAIIRYRTPAISCIVENNYVTFDTSVRLPAPGQHIVFYDKNRVAGGGIIA